jgi:hypothetical protein
VGQHTLGLLQSSGSGFCKSISRRVALFSFALAIIASMYTTSNQAVDFRLLFPVLVNSVLPGKITTHLAVFAPRLARAVGEFVRRDVHQRFAVIVQEHHRHILPFVVVGNSAGIDKSGRCSNAHTGMKALGVRPVTPDVTIATPAFVRVCYFDPQG